MYQNQNQDEDDDHDHEVILASISKQENYTTADRLMSKPNLRIGSSMVLG